MTYNEYIQNIIDTRGQWSEEVKQNCGACERHHIVPKCLGGTGSVKKKHKNIIWLYPREHFIAHKLLAEENKDNYSLVYAYHMMATQSKDISRAIEITPEEYEEAKLLWLPFCKELASKNAEGRHWYTNNSDKDIFVYECPEGYWSGRSDKTKKNIGKESIGRKVGSGKHMYNNGINQKAFNDNEVPDGWIRGCLPMSNEAKLAHSKSLKGNIKCIKPTNRGFETLIEFEKRVDFNNFKIEFFSGKSDIELSVLFNTTKRMCEKYRRKYKLFMSLRG